MRLPNGYGSVYKLSGNRRKPYAARKTTGFDDKGYPIYEYIGYYQTRSDALKALASANDIDINGSYKNITFERVYELWSDEFFNKASTGKSTIASQRSAYKVCAPLYEIPMIKIKLRDLQATIDSSGKNQPTLENVKVLWGHMFKFAEKKEMITHVDFLPLVDISERPEGKRVAKKVFTDEELKTLWENKDNDCVASVLVLIYTGLRISELLELREYNLQEQWLKITKAKTKSSIRTVPIADKIVPIFERAHNYASNVNYQMYRNQFLDILSSLDMEHTIHETRHTCNSRMFNVGIDDITRRKILGHVGQSVNETVYTHAGLKVMLNAVNKI